MQHKDAFSEFRDVYDAKRAGVLSNSNLAYADPDGTHRSPVCWLEATLNAIELVATLAASTEREFTQVIECCANELQSLRKAEIDVEPGRLSDEFKSHHSRVLSQRRRFGT